MQHILKLALLLPTLSMTPLLGTQANGNQIYKCTSKQGNTLYQQACPKGYKAERQAVSEVSNLGFSNQDSQLLALNQELALNGDFEEELAQWSIRKQSNADSPSEPESGTAEQDTPDSIFVSILPREGNSGSAALQLSADGKEASQARVMQCQPSKNIGSVSLSAFIKQEGASQLDNNELNLVWFTSDDCSSGGQYGARLHPTAAPGWQQIQAKDILPALGSRSFMLEVVHSHLGTNTDPSQALWDNVSLTVTSLNQQTQAKAITAHTRPLGENHLSNAQFVSNLQNWKSTWPLEWMEFGGESVTAGAHTRAISDFGQKKTGDALEQCVNIGLNTHFSAGISYKKDPLSSQAGNGRMRLTWYEEENCTGRQQFGSDTDTIDAEDWQKLESETSAPEGAKSLVFRIEQTIEGAGFYGVFWDNAYFMAIEKTEEK